jgi:hypothetical protein
MKQRRGYIGLRTFSPAEIAHLVEERVQYFPKRPNAAGLALPCLTLRRASSLVISISAAE